MRFILIQLVVGGLLLTGAASAKIYKWTDAEGKVHYTQHPPPAGLTNGEEMNVGGAADAGDSDEVNHETGSGVAAEDDDAEEGKSPVPETLAGKKALLQGRWFYDGDESTSELIFRRDGTVTRDNTLKGQQWTVGDGEWSLNGDVLKMTMRYTMEGSRGSIGSRHRYRIEKLTTSSLVLVDLGAYYDSELEFTRR